MDYVDANKDEDEGSILLEFYPSLLWNCKVLFLQSWRETTTLSQGLLRRAKKEELWCGKYIATKDIANLTLTN